ncbi:ArnT family glycosyltransferase [Paenibacillus gansuensis]|uniref:ArnT family glycosyltransferase n=1 Tax=Paenibacillus gansuensis TaxID=306542 RepID=A0ABW5PHQ8_9BACL
MATKWRSRVDVWLVLTALLAAFLNGYNIWNDAYANSYYTTAVASMLENFHNFFYGSLDSAGSVTVDKPPLTFWIQTISAWLFGLHGWSVILPQALAGVGSVLLLYILVKPTFGVMAARLSALAMACTPIAAAVSRTNNIDSMLVFALLVGTWLLFKGIRNQSVWSVLGAFAMIGVAFNMKMLQAYMVAPAFYLFYLAAAKGNWQRKIGMLAASTVLMLGISVSWAVVVDSIPADQRPYIGSSETNSVMELAFGYNGISRLTGEKGTNGGFVQMPLGGGAQGNITAPGAVSGGTSGKATGQGAPGQGVQGQGSPGQAAPGGGNVMAPSGTAPTSGPLFGGAPGAGEGFPGGKGGPAGGMFGTGEKGPLRLFQSALSGQASWLIPFAVLASVALLAGLRRRNMTQKHLETAFWLGWLLPTGAFFSVAGFFHHYYLIMLAPPLAALFGAGFTQLYADYRDADGGWKSWLLPSAVLLTAGFQWYIIHPFDDAIGAGWSIGIALAGVLLTAALAAYKFRQLPYVQGAAITAALALLIGPLYWAATPIAYGGSSMLPQAGPTGDGAPIGGNFMRQAGALPAMGGAQMPLPPSGGELPVLQGGTQLPLPSGGQAPVLPGGGQLPANPADMTPEQLKQLQNMFQHGGGMPGMNAPKADPKLVSYLKEHNTGEKYLFASSNYNTAAPYMIDERASVVILSGFSGRDPVYNAEKLEKLVASGKVKYFLISEGGMPGGGSEVNDWIKAHGKAVPESEWKTQDAASSEKANTTSANQKTAANQETPANSALPSPMGTFGSETLYEVTLN